MENKFVIRTKYMNKFRFIPIMRDELTAKKYVDKGNYFFL